ncbi:MAG: acetylornithine/succinylornithine family transaminase [Spirochaetes bacterium]|nr:acetylornithine/succinylornithine family transaminase [Spirochaetota bacterium]
MDTRKLLQIANKKLLKVTNRPDIVIRKGKGMYLYDTEGNKYLDFVAGWAVNSLGHSPKEVANAIKKQAKTLVNASPAFFNEPMLEYADLITENSCFSRVFFCSIGAEANEGAIKLARKYGAVFKKGASDIITTRNSFHGRTLTTMAASGKTAFEKLFEPKTKGFSKAKFNDISSLKKLITKQTCAVMLEPIQGEAGINLADRDYIKELRNICDKENILLIFDEIQTGMGRTGKLFCYEQYDVEPDIMTLAKGIGGGFPLAAVLAKENLNIFEPGEQGGTYTAQPLAMAVGLAVLKKLLTGGVIENCSKMGSIIMNELNSLSKEYEIENVRGMGLLIGFDLQKTKGADFVNKCLKNGLLINAPQEKAVRLMPALTVREKEIAEMFTVLKKNLEKK